MVTTIPYSRKGRERKVYEAAPIIKSTVASVHHHPFPFPKEEGVIYGHDHHHQIPLSEGEQGIWPWSQPFPIPEKEGVTTTPSLSQKRKECIWP